MKSEKIEWRAIPGYEGHYEVSNEGEGRSLDRSVPRGNHEKRIKGVPLAQRLDKIGRPRFSLWKDGKGKDMEVSHAVAFAFIGPRPEGLVICHNDGNPENNSVENLRYDTQSGNLLDMREHGTHCRGKFTHCQYGHKKGEPNVIPSVSRKGMNSCRACHAGKEYMRRNGIEFTKDNVQRITDSYYRSYFEKEGE